MVINTKFTRPVAKILKCDQIRRLFWLSLTLFSYRLSGSSWPVDQINRTELNTLAAITFCNALIALVLTIRLDTAFIAHVA